MFTVAALYRFTRFDDPAALCGPLARLCRERGVQGILLIAPEGINGTVAGARGDVEAVLDHIRTLPGCAGLEWKESTAETRPFLRMKVRLKREIVTMGQPGVDPAAGTGRHVDPVDWNALIATPDVAVIDTRNDYEVGIGTFAGAVNPQTPTFRDFPAWWEKNAQRFAGKRIAMFCTGGIRCEKSTNFLLSKGVEDVFHLRGGILKYLEQVPRERSVWKGECFVFDQRVAVGHGLSRGTHTLCHACRRPVPAGDRNHAAYEAGVSCPACIDMVSDADRVRFRERQRQIGLARARGREHLGRQ